MSLNQNLRRMEAGFELASPFRVVNSACESVSLNISQLPISRITDRAVLILSVGVTATTLSTAPAIIPASIPRPGESTPRSSATALRMVSYDTNLTAALAVVPYVLGQCLFRHESM